MWRECSSGYLADMCQAMADVDAAMQLQKRVTRNAVYTVVPLHLKREYIRRCEARLKELRAGKGDME